MKTNRERLVMQSVQGRIHHPTMSGSGYRVGSDGVPRILPATGGITYNFKLGDNCMDIVGDHVEPGVSIKNSDSREDTALNALACVGNVAKVITGDAKGAIGYVSGKHGGVDHVMCWFEPDVLERMIVDDKIMIRSFGQGLMMEEFPQVKIMNLDPDLFEQMGIYSEDGKLHIPVVMELPAYLMGAGLGASTMMSGDYDIMTRDQKAYEKFGLGRLRFGDMVLIRDHTCLHGADYCEGAVSVGVIVHSDSFGSGHGPGVTILFTSQEPLIEGVIDEDANISHYLAKHNTEK